MVYWAEFWYNTTFHVSTGRTPFEVAYGRQPPNLIRFLINETKVTAVALEFIKRDKALNQFKVHSTSTRAQMRKYADRKRRVVNFKVGEWVS